MRRGIRIDGSSWSDDDSHIGPWHDGINCDNGQHGGLFQTIIWMDGVWGDGVLDERVISNQVG